MESFRKRFTHVTSTANHEDEEIDLELKRENDLYKCDILEASIKLKRSNITIEDKIRHVRKMGIISWTGGAGISKYASKYIFEYIEILRETKESPKLRIALLKSIIEISWLNEEIKESMLEKNALAIIASILDENENDCTDLQYWAVYTLLCLGSGSYTVQKQLLQLGNLGKQLRKLSQERWPSWTYNEALKLIELLGLPEEEDSSNNDDDTIVDFW